MTPLNDEERRLLQRLNDVLAELYPYMSRKEKLRTDKQLRYTVERLFIKAGELMTRLKNKKSNVYNSHSIFRTLVSYRNKLAHTINTNLEIVINSLTEIPLLQKEVDNLIMNSSSQNRTFSNFENFGGYGNKRGRKRFIDAILDKIKRGLGIEQKPISFPRERGIVSISVAADKITNDKNLIALSKENDGIATQITEDIAKWAKRTFKKVHKDNPFEEEQELFDDVSEQEVNHFAKSFSTLKDTLSPIYHKGEINLSFFAKRLAELNQAAKVEDLVKEIIINASNGKVENIPNLKQFAKTDFFKKLAPSLKVINGNLSPLYKKAKEDLVAQREVLKSSFLKDWKKVLTKKQLNYELEEINKARESFSNELYQKIDDYKQLKKLLEPFTRDVGRLWDLTGGLWNKVGLEILQKYANLLENDDKLRELAELLGRFRKIEHEQEEISFEETIIKPKWKINHAQKSELIGIIESNDINNMLPSEVALLSDKATEDIFYKKFTEKKLLTFEYENRFLAKNEEKVISNKKQDKEKDKGPIIICVDTSGSMRGAPERIAKLICFAILKLAYQDLRKCYLISFSTQIETLALTEFRSSLDKLVQFLQMSFHGGTDLSPALVEALRVLETNEFKKADVLLISDFVMPKLEENISNQIKLAQENKTQFHSLTISKSGNNNVLNQFNHNWVYNPENSNSLLELVHNIKEIQNKQSTN